MICITKPICGPDSSLCCTILHCPRALKESTEGFLCRNKLQQWQTTRVSSDTSPRSSHRHKCSAEAAGMRSIGQCWNKDLKAEVTISVLLGFPTPYTAEQSPPSLNSQSQAVLNWVYQFLIFAVKPLPAIQLKNHKVLSFVWQFPPLWVHRPSSKVHFGWRPRWRNMVRNTKANLGWAVRQQSGCQS